MDARTAESHFKKADSLYRDGRYAEALDFLIELDEAFPNTPNILFPLARCLRHVGRVDESLAICDDLITRCGDLRALQLREFIRKSHNPTTEETPTPHYSIEGLNQDAHAGALDDLLIDSPPPTPMLPEIGEPQSNKKRLLIGGIALAVLLVLLVVLPVFVRLASGASQGYATPNLSGTATTPAEIDPSTAHVQEREHAEAAGNIMATMVTVLLIGSLIGNIAALYIVLLIRQKLPYESLADNLLNVSFMGLGLAILNSVLPCIGLIPSYFILRRSYDFVFVDFLIWLAMNAAVGVVLFIVSQVFTGIMIA
ncbi:MAG: tetratricopeptide repeat protein [Candidatus Hydrogenedentes bacterium]|nr:tetratricopeptide repeat protein [Candidatus Hydrogenedentota bacterium]